jgi:hypothetical protein
VKRKAILEKMGHEVAICSAYGWADFPVPLLEFDSEEVTKMMRNLFGVGIVDFADEAGLKRAFDISVLELKQQFTRVIENFKP